MTDPPSIAGARLRALGFAPFGAAAIRPLARLRRAQVAINGIWYELRRELDHGVELDTIRSLSPGRAIARRFRLTSSSTARELRLDLLQPIHKAGEVAFVRELAA